VPIRLQEIPLRGKIDSAKAANLRRNELRFEELKYHGARRFRTHERKMTHFGVVHRDEPELFEAEHLKEWLEYLEFRVICGARAESRVAASLLEEVLDGGWEFTDSFREHILDVIFMGGS
jgi:hypothetical protein